ncbi:hypothetical protein ACSNOI_00475 [Actinomadura kijaniata]|uniref:hypothetical protein n=1 Tax=Actinomadura kijaniata TaxID=46161 RepID=UPI003F1C0B50
MAIDATIVDLRPAPRQPWPFLIDLVSCGAGSGVTRRRELPDEQQQKIETLSPVNGRTTSRGPNTERRISKVLFRSRPGRGVIPGSTLGDGA